MAPGFWAILILSFTDYIIRFIKLASMKWKILEIFKLVQRGNMRQIKSYLFKRQQELPWWLSGRESRCQCRRHGFDPWSGRIPHAVEHLKSTSHSSWAHSLEPGSRKYWAHVPQLLKAACPRAHAPQEEEPLQWGACIPQLECSPCLPKEQWRPSTAKNR